MSQLFFKRLMENVDSREPDKAFLHKVFRREVRKLDFTEIELLLLDVAFEISFEGHKKVPARKSGEAYFFHPFRAALRMSWRQFRLGVRDAQAIAEELGHDCFEEAPEDGISPLLIKTAVQIQLGASIAYDIYCVTKHKERGETSEQYCARLAECDVWRPLVVKFEDRIDNMWTMDAMPLEKQRSKIAETEKWFPVFRDRLVRLIEIKIAAGKLDPGWARVPHVLYNYLFRVVRLKKSQYGIA